MLCVGDEGTTILSTPPVLQQSMVLPARNLCRVKLHPLRQTAATFSSETRLFVGEMQRTTEGCVSPGWTMFSTAVRAGKSAREISVFTQGKVEPRVSLQGSRLSLLEV